MPACFYNGNGTMIGGDVHDYYTVNPEVPPVPLPIKAAHFVVTSLDGLCDDKKTRPKNVTSDGQPMIQKGFKRIAVGPHLPLTPAPPHAFEVVLWATIVRLSGSVAILAVSTVTGAGAPLATCIANCVGTNLNCGDPIDWPLDAVFNENSVLTQPTGADFADAIFTFATSGLVSLLVGWGFDKAAARQWGKRLEKELKEALIPIRKKAEDVVKDFLNERVKDFKEKVLSRASLQASLSSLGVTHV